MRKVLGDIVSKKKMQEITSLRSVLMYINCATVHMPIDYRYDEYRFMRNARYEVAQTPEMPCYQVPKRLTMHLV